MKMTMNTTAVILAVGLLLLLSLTAPSHSSLLPLLDRHRGSGSSTGNSPITEQIPDPFRILEQIPLGIGLDDEVLPPARVEWKETPEAHIIMLDVPGLKKEDLKIEVDVNRILWVSGERKKEEVKKDDQFHVVERVYGKFWRQFRLSENVDLDSVKARLEHGVLTITLKKVSPEQVRVPRVVSIEAEETHEKAGQLGSGGDGKEKKLEL